MSDIDPCYLTPEYQAFVAEMAKHCHCSPPFDRPCDGVLAGGLCDNMGNEPEDDLYGGDPDEEHEL